MGSTSTQASTSTQSAPGYAGSEVVEFTRTSELAATMAVVEANLAAMAQ